MLNALISRFENTCAFVAHTQGGKFNALLEAAAGGEDLPQLMMSHADVSMSDSFWPEKDSWESHYRPYNVANGVLTIPVQGTLISGFPYVFGSWLTGYEYIRRAVMRGMADPDVKGIAFLIDSPGGEVSGNFDLVDYIYSMRGTKPMKAFAHDSAYSAAYSLASAADKIVMSRSGGVGSIGVVTSHVDLSEMLKKEGVKVTFIHYGKHKVDGNPYEALKPEVKERIQKRIDALGEEFVAIVARNRNMDEEAVRKTEALTYSASEALSIGLADSVGPLEDAVAAFAVELSNTEGEEQMADKPNTAAVDQAAIDNARAEGVAQGKKEGAVAERERICAILDSDEGKSRPIAARAAALDTGMDAEAAKAFIAKLPEEKAEAAAPAVEEKPNKANGQDFSAAMNADKPEVGAEGGDEEQPKCKASSTAALMGWNGDK